MSASRLRESRLREVVAQAAEPLAEYDYKLWGFGEGPGIEGLVAAGEVLGRPELIDRAAELARRSLRELPAEPLADHVLPVPALLELRDRRDLPGLKERVRRWVDLVDGRETATTGEPRRHRPDRDDVGQWVWVDCMHTDGPGLAAVGHHQGAHTVLEHSGAALQDTTGLFAHGYDAVRSRSNGIHWGRGCGWALWGLVETLERAPSPSSEARLERLLRALAAHERDGRWRTIVDDPEAPHERSVSPMVAAGLLRGLSGGVLGPAWAPLAARALDAAVADTADDGTLAVSAATPVGDREVYLTRAEGIFPWGQGPLVLACARALAPTRSERTT